MRNRWTPARIKRLRLALGMTQLEFAVAIGHGTQAISVWERGIHAPLSRARKELDKLAEVGVGRAAEVSGGT